MKNTNPHNFPPLIKALFGAAFLIVSFAVFTYVYAFGGFGNIGSQEQFGLLGDYMGGLLNPILTFLTVVLLIWSIRVQLHELAATRMELSETTKIQGKLLAASQKEVIRKQLHDDSNLYIKNCEELLDKPILKYKNSDLMAIMDQGAEVFISVNDTFKNSTYYNNNDVSDLIRKIPDYLVNDSGVESLHLNSIKTQLGFAVSSVCQLLGYLELQVLRTSWESRVTTLITDCSSVGILTSEESDDMTAEILGAIIANPLEQT